jgi:hypothetical protein
MAASLQCTPTLQSTLRLWRSCSNRCDTRLLRSKRRRATTLVSRAPLALPECPTRACRDAYLTVLCTCRIRRGAHSPLRPPSTAAAAADDDATAPKATVQFTVAESTDSSAGGINRQRKRGGGTMTLKKVSPLPLSPHHLVFPTTQLLSLSPL